MKKESINKYVQLTIGIILVSFGFFLLSINKFPVVVECPNYQYCGKQFVTFVTKHNPLGVSHSETHYCPHCEMRIILIVYYDKEVFVERAYYNDGVNWAHYRFYNYPYKEVHSHD